MYVYNLSAGAWDPVEAEQTLEGTAMSLSGVVELAEHLNGDTVRIMIQNGEGYTPPQYASGEASDSATYNEKDTPREIMTLPSWWRATPSTTTRTTRAIPARM